MKRDFGGQGPMESEGCSELIDSLQNLELGKKLKGTTDKFIPLKEKTEK
jgi:hypothetical protein